MKSSVLLLSLAASALAVPAPSKRHVVHERRDALPHSWSEPRRVDGRTQLPVRIGLTQSNIDESHDMLMDIASPSSPNYRKYMTVHEVNELFAPAGEAVSAVRDWLESAGIAAERVTQSANKQWLQFDGDAAEVESLLGAEYYIYTHDTNGRSHMGCEKYHVPEHISHHIDYIIPGVKSLEVREPQPAELEKRTFGFRKPQPPLFKALPESLETIINSILGGLLDLCSTVITPSCIKTLYNITEGTTATKGNELGIFEDLGDYYSQTDLDLFFTLFYSQIPAGTGPTLKGIDGAQAPTQTLTQAGPESDLDFQVSYPIIWPQNSILFQTDDANYEANYTFNGFLNNFLDAIDGSYCTYSAFGIDGNTADDPPYPDPASNGYKGSLQCGVYEPTNVISISYGGDEAGLSVNYQKRQCNEYKKLGLQGVSVVVSSGDSGVAGADGCLGGGKIFNPDFPAGCPYITTVGATYLPSGASSTSDSEVAVSRFPSGGGFSNIYTRPSYQSDAVNTYLTQHTPPYPAYETSDNSSVGANGGIYNKAGRGYPDVAAVGDNIVIFNAGAPTLIGGTSASAPIFASILTRINEVLLAKKGTTVGFVNPTLYANPDAFHDITSGDNPGCSTNGFSTAPGWDPVTGLGTPNYPALLKVFLGE